MKYNKFVVWIALVAVLAMCLTACSNGPASSTEPTEAPIRATLAEVLAPQRSLVMNSGDSYQLPLSADWEATFASSDEKVAAVDQNGNVTAVGRGMAFITVSSGDESVRCGVLVDAVGSMIDITNMSAQEIFTDIELHSGTEIMGMAVDAENQVVYFSQGYGSASYVPLNSELLINKVEKKDDAWELTSWMRFSGSGKGPICVDNDGKTPRLWMECSGDYIGYGKAISLVDWSDNSYCQDTYGQVFHPQGVTGSMTVTADTENNMVLVYDRAEKCYRIYNRAEMLAGEEAPEYVHSFACASNQTPATGVDDSQGRYNASIRGYALYDSYLYQFSGSSSVYLSVFDLEGNLQYCHRLENLPDVDYYMPASISIADGKIYVVFATGSSDYNFANLVVFA